MSTSASSRYDSDSRTVSRATDDRTAEASTAERVDAVRQRADAAATLDAEVEETSAHRRLSDLFVDFAVGIPLAVAAVGVAGVGAGLFVGDPLLLAVGGTALFMAAMVTALRPPRSQEAADAVFAQLADNHAALVDALDLSETQVYVPTGEHPSVRLYVPRDPEAPIPDHAALDGVVVEDGSTPEPLGLGLETTGTAVATGLGPLQRFEDLPVEPTPLFDELRSLLADRLELVEGSTAVVDGQKGRAVLSFERPRFGDISRFDHPARAFVAVMAALRLDRPVAVTVVPTTDGGHRIRYTWSVD